jgi:lipoprotein-releasing system permease protein
MGYEWFIAGRYLRGTHRGRVRICTAGVTIGVTVLVVVISVMNGFEKEFLGKMLGAFGHLRLYQRTSDRINPQFISDYRNWVERFEARPGVVAAAPAIEQEAFLVARPRRSTQSKSHGVRIRGIEPEYENRVNDFADYLLLGDWSDLAERSPEPEEAPEGPIDPFEATATLEVRMNLFLGVELAKELFDLQPHWHWSESDNRLRSALEQEVIGQTVTVIIPEIERGPNLTNIRRYSATVKGIYKSGFYDFDLNYTLTALETERIFKKIPVGEVEFLEVKVEDPNRAERIGFELADWAEQECETVFSPWSWQRLNPTLLEAVHIEKAVMATILTMVILVAAFGISSTLVMTVLEKTREIGTLMALGARRRSLMAIFVINGLLVGVIGVVFGLLAGLGICGLIRFLEIPMPGGGVVYVLETLPVEVRWFDVGLIALFGLLASTVAGIYPAYKASRLHPVEALRHE